MPGAGPWLSIKHTVHVVTAFAIGHSITLALAGFGLIHPPSQIVESLIALSVLVSAIHAIRPLIRGGEAIIAFSFGLAHGLAFANLLGALGLTGTALIGPLLGFNLGIELTHGADAPRIDSGGVKAVRIALRRARGGEHAGCQYAEAAGQLFAAGEGQAQAGCVSLQVGHFAAHVFYG